MMRFTHLITIVLCSILFIATIPVSAQESIAVVVNKNNPVENLSRSELIDLFMGKYVAFPDDSMAVPVELEKDGELKVNFYQELVGMSLSGVNAYWSRLRFTGRKRAAQFKHNEKEIINFIMENEQAIGYIPYSKLTQDLKVVYILNE